MYVDFRELRRLITVSEVLALVGYPSAARSAAGEWRGPCPIHRSQSKRPRSFAVAPDNRSWYCHSCRRGGDVIDLWTAVNGYLNLRDGGIALSFQFGIGTEKRNG